MLPQKGILSSDQNHERPFIPKPAEPEQKAGARPKENFEDIADIAAKQKAEAAEKLRRMEKGEKQKDVEDQIHKLNAIGKKSEGAELQEEYSEEELQLAEQLLFDGFIKKDIEISKRHKATFYTVSAAETEIINEMIFEYTKQYEKDGKYDIPARSIDLLQQMYLLALSFQGFDGKDFSKARTRSLELIKNAIKHMSELELSGEIEKFKSLREEIKGAVRARASEMKGGLAAPTVDALSAKRFEFERRMYNIINKGDNLIPKF